MLKGLLSSTLLPLLLTDVAASEQLRQRRRTSDLVLPAELKPKQVPALLEKRLSELKAKNLNKEMLKQKEPSATKEFDPERDDPAWPGMYPTEGSGVNLMVNIRADAHPKEIQVWSQAVAPPIVDGSLVSTSSSSIVTKHMATRSPENKQVSGFGELWNYELKRLDTPGSLYRIEVLDFGGNGICCEFGNGWITVTDANRNVLLETVGDGYTHVFAGYVWLDEQMQYEVVASTGATNSTRPEDACDFCPGAAIGAPDNYIVTRDGEGKLYCWQVADLYSTSFTDDECLEYADSGSTGFWRVLCECPEYKANCELCSGGTMGAPDKLFTFENGNSTNCFKMEQDFLWFTDDDCDDWDDASEGGSAHDSIAEYCECT